MVAVSSSGAPDGGSGRAVGVTASVRSGVFQATPTPMPPPCETRVNESIVWATPSSRRSKSEAARSVTRRLFRSRTTASTRIAVVVDVIACLAGGVAWAIPTKTTAAQNSFMVTP